MPPSESQLSIQESSTPISPASGVEAPIPMDFISGVIETATIRWPHSHRVPSTTMGSASSTAGSSLRYWTVIQPPLSCGRPINAAGKQRPGLLRPTPLGPALSLFAEPELVSESEIVVTAELVYDEKQRVTVRAQWLRFRPR